MRVVETTLSGGKNYTQRRISGDWPEKQKAQPRRIALIAIFIKGFHPAIN
ncbi:hypothetical protein [Rhodonellum sp.]|nr:hypothetical protein [Rhodonellum sp.]MDO9553396.1 hypothetical protein [Rhodonellum sp.]